MKEETQILYNELLLKGFRFYQTPEQRYVQWRVSSPRGDVGFFNTLEEALIYVVRNEIPPT